MFKTLEKKWNAHTPVYLHNGTKENIIFQLSLGGLMILGFVLKDYWNERKLRREYDKTN